MANITVHGTSGVAAAHKATAAGHTVDAQKERTAQAVQDALGPIITQTAEGIGAQLATMRRAPPAHKHAHKPTHKHHKPHQHSVIGDFINQMKKAQADVAAAQQREE